MVHIPKYIYIYILHKIFKLKKKNVDADSKKTTAEWEKKLICNNTAAIIIISNTFFHEHGKSR